MKVAILGQGSLGLYLEQTLRYLDIDCESYSLRKDLFCNVLPCNAHVLIDCMDPASSDTPNLLEIRALTRNIRRSLTERVDFHHYIYLSSANVYQPSSSIITESSTVSQPTSETVSTYVAHKLQTESDLRHCLGSTLSVMRPGALWKPSYDQESQGFFADLYRHKHFGHSIKDYPTDSSVITYLSFRNAAQIICYFISDAPSLPPILNISMEIWSTRQSLKRNEIYDPRDANPGIRLASYYYNPIYLPFGVEHLP